ncbi:hypothetical protein J1N35_025360, partial [Gossypium stocksii]
FASDHNVFFEFHLSYCVVKDILTREIMLRGHIHDGFYYFSLVSPDPSIAAPSIYNTSLHARNDGYDVFALWHQ